MLATCLGSSTVTVLQGIPEAEAAGRLTAAVPSSCGGGCGAPYGSLCCVHTCARSSSSTLREGGKECQGNFERMKRCAVCLPPEPLGCMAGTGALAHVGEKASHE